MTLIARPIAQNVGRTEGPVFLSSGDILFLGMTHGRVYSLDDRGVEVFAEVGMRPNGATEARDGCVYVEAYITDRHGNGPHAKTACLQPKLPSAP